MIGAEKCREQTSRSEVGGDLALPKHEYAPAERAERGFGLKVALAVALELGEPVVEPGLGLPRQTTSGVLVPEAAVDEHDPPQAREHEVRRTGQVGAVQAEAVAETVGGAPHAHLGFGTGLADAAHVVASGTW